MPFRLLLIPVLIFAAACARSGTSKAGTTPDSELMAGDGPDPTQGPSADAPINPGQLPDPNAAPTPSEAVDPKAGPTAGGKMDPKVGPTETGGAPFPGDQVDPNAKANPE